MPIEDNEVKYIYYPILFHCFPNLNQRKIKNIYLFWCSQLIELSRLHNSSERLTFDGIKRRLQHMNPNKQNPVDLIITMVSHHYLFKGKTYLLSPVYLDIYVKRDFLKKQ